jgi:hypothetical protein
MAAVTLAANAAAGASLVGPAPNYTVFDTHTFPAAPTQWTTPAYGNGVLVSLADSSSVAAVSTDLGVTWTTQSIALGAASYTNPAFGAGLFVGLVYSSASYITSPDGTTWTTRTLPASHLWDSIIYGGGQFCALSGDGYAAASSDGLSWTITAMPSTGTSPYWNSVVYGNGMFVASAYGSAAQASSTNAFQSGSTANLLNPLAAGSTASPATAFGRGVFVSIKDDMVALSTNGLPTTYSTIGAIPTSGRQWQLCFDGRNFIAVEPNSSDMILSQDGLTWVLYSLPISGADGVFSTSGAVIIIPAAAGTTSITIGNGPTASSAAASGVQLAANAVASAAFSTTFTYNVVSMSATALASASMPVYTPSYTSPATFSAPATSSFWRGVAYGNGQFVAVPYAAASVDVSSDNGATWTTVTLSYLGGNTQVAYGNGLFVIFSYLSTSYHTSPDGFTWTTRTLPASYKWVDLAFGGGLFCALSNDGYAATSADGISWVFSTMPTIPTGTGLQGWNGVCYGNGVFRAWTYGGSGMQAISPSGFQSAITYNTNDPFKPADGPPSAYGNGKFVSISGQVVASSPNGLHTTSSSIGSIAPAGTNWTISFDGGNFIAVAGTTTTILTSADGVTWAAHTAPVAGAVACSGNGVTVVMPSDTGTTGYTMPAGGGLVLSAVAPITTATTVVLAVAFSAAATVQAALAFTNTTLSASATAIASATAALSTSGVVALGAAGVSSASASASIMVQRVLLATAVATAATGCSIALSVPLAADAHSVASGSPALSLSKLLSSVQVASASASAGLLNYPLLQASAVASASASASATIRALLAAQAQAQAQATGAVMQAVQLAGTGAAQASAPAALLITVQMGAAPAATALASSAASIQKLMAASPAAEASGSGAILQTYSLAAGAQAQASMVPNFSTAMTLSAQAYATATMSASITSGFVFKSNRLRTIIVPAEARMVKSNI